MRETVPGLTVEENLAELILSEGGRLENEVSMNLKSELHKQVNANEVFDALSRGYSKFQAPLSQSRVSGSPTLSDTLDKLMKMMVVVKRAPVNDPNNRKKAGYFISDTLSLFYYKYIYRSSAQRAVKKTVSQELSPKASSPEEFAPDGFAPDDLAPEEFAPEKLILITLDDMYEL